MRYLLLITYDGTDFSGWQNQPGKRTVQSVMEKTAEQIFGTSTAVTASGRTDSGVHATGQIVQFDADTSIPPEKLAACFNRLLPGDVKVLKSAEAQDGFDCTRGAKRKTYVYSAYYAQTELPLLGRYAARLKRKPDAERMRAAAKLLIGEHDFAAFRSSGFTSKTSVRELYAVDIIETPEKGYTYYQIRVTGNGFLYNMVRIVCGELFAVGCGREEGITRAFENLKRSELAKTMPPQGLCLEEVEYDAPIFGEES